MSITQSEFEKQLTTVLNNDGFDLSKKDVQELLANIGATVESCLAQDVKTQKKLGDEGGNPSVVVRGMGKYTIRQYKARMGRNPATGATIKIKASRRMRVAAPKPMRDGLKVK